MSSALAFTYMMLMASPLAAEAVERSHAHANPIRKVVNLLQQMQTKVEEEGEKEQALFDKFMCYCKSSSGDLEASIAAAEEKLPQLAAEIEKTEESDAQTKEDITAAQADKASAKTAIAEATGIREKEAAAFAAEKAEYEANIGAITKAVAALEKGMAGAFLQTNAVQTLQKLAQDSKKLFDDDREKIMSFLSSGSQEDSEYAPSSGEVTGILKQMGDEMAAGLKEATAAENAAIAAYDDLVASKNKELETLQKVIEEKLKQSGDKSIEIAQMKNDLTDTQEALAADKQFLAEMDETCKKKQEEWAVVVKTRGEELEALSDTIKLLNDDDALDLFKKTLPSASASFLQVQVTAASMRARALTMIKGMQKANSPHRVKVDLIALALRGKSQGFEKVIGMIDNMVAALKAEQEDDDAKKTYCAKEFDTADDSKKSLEKSIADTSKAIATTEDGLATTKEEIAALEKGLKALDKEVAEATEQRQEENAAFKEMMASDSAAKELIGVAKNRLNKFYNPKLYKAEPKRELSAEDRVVVEMGGTVAPTNAPGGISGTGITAFVQVHAHTQHKHKVAPPPPPEAVGAYSKKSEESGGVMAMMDMLVADLDKEMTQGKAEEKDAQADYDAMMKDSAAKRAADAKSLTEKESTKAELEEALESNGEAKADFEKELAATMEYINSLHLECDWLLKYFDVRKEARASEIDALGKAKAVLSGADYSLLQTKSRHHLRRRAH